MGEPLGCTSRVCVIDATCWKYEVLQLEVAARGESVVSFGDYSSGVLEARYQCAAVDEVEGMREDPVVLGVVYYETAVGGNAGLC